MCRLHHSALVVSLHSVHSVLCCGILEDTKFHSVRNVGLLHFWWTDHPTYCYESCLVAG